MLSRCPHCDNTTFEFELHEPVNANYKTNVFQCVACKAAIGAMEYYDAGTLIKEQEVRFDQLDQSLSQLEYRVSVLTNAVADLVRKLP